MNDLRYDNTIPMPRRDMRVMFMHVCACGQPHLAYSVLYRLLVWFWVKGECGPKNYDPAWYRQTDAWLDAITPQKDMQYLLFYLVSALDLEEHGGSVPGWLTQKGEALMLGLGREIADDFETLTDMHCAHGFDIDDETHDCINFQEN